MSHTKTGSGFGKSSNIQHKSAVSKTASALKNKYNAMVTLKKVDSSPEKIKRVLQANTSRESVVEEMDMEMEYDDEEVSFRVIDSSGIHESDELDDESKDVNNSGEKTVDTNDGVIDEIYGLESVGTKPDADSSNKVEVKVKAAESTSIVDKLASKIQAMQEESEVTEGELQKVNETDTVEKEEIVEEEIGKEFEVGKNENSKGTEDKQGISDEFSVQSEKAKLIESSKVSPSVEKEKEIDHTVPTNEVKEPASKQSEKVQTETSAVVNDEEIDIRNVEEERLAVSKEKYRLKLDTMIQSCKEKLGVESEEIAAANSGDSESESSSSSSEDEDASDDGVSDIENMEVGDETSQGSVKKPDQVAVKIVSDEITNTTSEVDEVRADKTSVLESEKGMVDKVDEQNGNDATDSKPDSISDKSKETTKDTKVDSSDETKDIAGELKDNLGESKDIVSESKLNKNDSDNEFSEMANESSDIQDLASVIDKCVANSSEASQSESSDVVETIDATIDDIGVVVNTDKTLKSGNANQAEALKEPVANITESDKTENEVIDSKCVENANSKETVNNMKDGQSEIVEKQAEIENETIVPEKPEDKEVGTKRVSEESDNDVKAGTSETDNHKAQASNNEDTETAHGVMEIEENDDSDLEDKLIIDLDSTPERSSSKKLKVSTGNLFKGKQSIDKHSKSKTSDNAKPKGIKSITKIVKPSMQLNPDKNTSTSTNKEHCSGIEKRRISDGSMSSGSLVLEDSSTNQNSQNVGTKYRKKMETSDSFSVGIIDHSR